MLKYDERYDSPDSPRPYPYVDEVIALNSTPSSCNSQIKVSRTKLLFTAIKVGKWSN